MNILLQSNFLDDSRSDVSIYSLSNNVNKEHICVAFEMFETHGHEYINSFLVLKTAILLGSRTMKNCVLVADITKNVILGIEVMTKLELPLDLKRRCLRVADEEIFLHNRREGSVKVVIETDCSSS